MAGRGEGRDMGRRGRDSGRPGVRSPVGSGGRTRCVREREGESGRWRERILSHLNLDSHSSDKAGEGATWVIFQTCIQEIILSRK